MALFIFSTFKYSTRRQKEYIKRSANRGFINREFQVGNLCSIGIHSTNHRVCVCLIIRSLNLHVRESGFPGNTQAFAAGSNTRTPDIPINSAAFEVTLVGLTSYLTVQSFNRFISSGDCTRMYTVTT